MLLYEHEGFIEAEAKEIQQLCRSTFAVSFGNPDQNKYELQASLCDYLDKDEQRCRIAFYDKSLKKALVFTVAGTEKTSLWQHGREVLLELGYQLEDVNLKFSPAMLEVVLRDVPGLASPAEAQLQRSEHQRLLAELQATCEERPESPQGKRAALKLSTEKRLQERACVLRELLEVLFSPEEETTDESAVLLAQIKDLSARLEEAEGLAESERSQKEFSEAITAAAEKRIQELEEILVDVETQSSDVLKQKRKVVALNGRIKELDADLTAARQELAEERAKQKQFVDDVKSANEQIVALQRALKESEDLREEAFAQLGEHESEAVRLDKNYIEAEFRIKALEQELKTAEQRADGFDEAVKLSDVLQVKLDKAEEQLKARLALEESLQEKLSAALEKHDGLQKSLKDAERLGQDNAVERSELSALQDRCAEFAKENEGLRKGFDQERRVREALERSAAENDLRIAALEEALSRAEAAVEELTTVKGDEAAGISAALDQKLKSLTLRFEQEHSAKEALENELEEAHKIIASLECMVRETEEGRKQEYSRKVAAEKDDERIQALEKRLRTLEDQLEGETFAKQALAEEFAAAEKKLAEQDILLAEATTAKREQVVIEETASVERGNAPKPTKPLPHELRPAPKKGAFFRPDWDLRGLPCNSTDKVFKAWETAFNVQMTIEGYPSQYCMAFMVVLKQGKQKSLYLLYRLKQNKHTLVCVPAKTPKDEASLQKAIKEGLDFLRKSGFEMDEMSVENIESTLGGYCLDPG